jgi:D-beta-D-heptose 7-phosphate kinase/D-beta-D-heptose 1-phosphate adenosyltransferase
MDELLAKLADWRPFRALVIGDFMLDQLLFGDAERLSADAPVPVLHVRRREDRPGGSANVCLDLVALKGHVIALGVVGNDPAGVDLRAALERAGDTLASGTRVDASELIVDPSRPTTVKQSLIGLAQARHPQKMFRLDFESRDPVPDAVAARLIERAQALIPTVDVVAIEDYDKGVCTPEVCRGVIDAARRAGKPVLVDPARGTDYSKYSRATAITPNRTEAEIATGLRTDADARTTHNARLAAALLARLDLQYVVLTLDRHGALLLNAGEEHPISIPTIARDVYDVTGAGDMFLAGLCAAAANGLSRVDAVRLANAAAGLEVEVFGVQPIPLERVHHALLVQGQALRGKVRTIDQIAVEAAARKRAGETIVFTNGCFDVLHSGHAALLEHAHASGGTKPFLVVGLNDDASVRRLKGPTRPINSEDDRARVLSAMGCVGAVVLFSQDTPLDLITAIKPDVLVKGADYTKDRVVGASHVESWGGRVELIPLVEGRSTTSTISRMRAAP